MATPWSFRRPIAAELLRARGQVAPTLQRRYRSALAGGLALVLVAGVSAAAVVEDDAVTTRADLAALGLEAQYPASPGVTVPETGDVELPPLDVDVQLGKSDVWHLPDVEAEQAAEQAAAEAAAAEAAAAEAAAAAEREAIAEREATAAASRSSARAAEPSGTDSQDDASAEEAAPAQDAPAAVTSGQGGERGAIGSMVNSYRAQNGLSTLGSDGTLDQVAQGWAEWMASNQTLQHNPSYRSQIGGGWSAAGENIVRNTGGASMSSSAVTSWMVDWWKNSSVHRANMLNTKYTHVGVGYAMGPGGPYAVLLLGGR